MYVASIKYDFKSKDAGAVAKWNGAMYIYTFLYNDAAGLLHHQVAIVNISHT